MRVTYIFPLTSGIQDTTKGKSSDELFQMFERLYANKRVTRRVGYSSTPTEFAEFRRLLRQPFTTSFKIPMGGGSQGAYEFTIIPKVESSMTHLQEIASRVTSATEPLTPGKAKSVARRLAEGLYSRLENKGIDLKSKMPIEVLQLDTGHFKILVKAFLKVGDGAGANQARACYGMFVVAGLITPF